MPGPEEEEEEEEGEEEEEWTRGAAAFKRGPNNTG